MPYSYRYDERVISMRELEEILCRNYGSSEHTRSDGCYMNDKWFSIDNILGLVSEEASFLISQQRKEK